MIRYFCGTCDAEVASLYDLVDITSRLSSRNREEWDNAGVKQDHVCKKCVAALKHFLKTLRDKPLSTVEAGSDMSARVN